MLLLWYYIKSLRFLWVFYRMYNLISTNLSLENKGKNHGMGVRRCIQYISLRRYESVHTLPPKSISFVCSKTTLIHCCVRGEDPEALPHSFRIYRGNRENNFWKQSKWMSISSFLRSSQFTTRRTVEKTLLSCHWGTKKL